MNIHTLTVTAPLHGTITSADTFIQCGTGGSACTGTYDYGTVVTLTATPATGYSFTAWTGACTGTGACPLTIDGDRAVGASFTLNTHTLTVTAPLHGTITGDTVIQCGTGGSACTGTYDYGTSVTLTATPDTGYSFDGWTGACTGTGACPLTIDGDKAVGATFTLNTHTVTVTPPPHGTITRHTGITCGTGGSACTGTYDYGTAVTLTATPDTGYGFTAWSGACTGTGACPLTMTAARRSAPASR